MKTFICTLLASTIVVLIVYQKGFFSNALLFWSYISLMIILLIRRSAVCLLESKAVYDPDEVIKRNKPFYINKTKWNYIQKKALIHKIGQDKFCSSINFIKPYYFSDRKIDYLRDEEWRYLIHKALEH